MSEEIKKEERNLELNLEDLDKVAGGQGNDRCPNGQHDEKPKCPYCGSENIKSVPQAHMTICLDCEREF